MQKVLAVFIFILLIPFFVILSLCIVLESSGGIFFSQKRTGYRNKPFILYKLRTMQKNAEEIKLQFSHLNEVDGPVFKIKNDPRYTKIGKLISHLGLDELPQLVNIIKGEMAFVGPRPLPLDEAKKIPQKDRKRVSVLPGITSLWVVNGGHRISFAKWMNLDLFYIIHKSVHLDIIIIIQTVLLFIRIFLKRII